MVALEEDGDFVFAVGGVLPTDGEDKLLMGFRPLGLVEAFRFFVGRSLSLLQIAQDSLVPEEGGPGEAHGLLEQSI